MTKDHIAARRHHCEVKSNLFMLKDKNPDQTYSVFVKKKKEREKGIPYRIVQKSSKWDKKYKRKISYLSLSTLRI